MTNAQRIKGKKYDWHNMFPLDTFHGETKKQLIELIKGIEAKAEMRGRLSILKEWEEDQEKFLQGFAYNPK